MNERKNILYLSYDGMTDPLGQSQVLPYIVGLSKAGYSFSLISFEKKHRFQQYRSIIEDICKRHNIKWYPLSFSSRPPFVSKLWDVYRMKQKAKELHTKYNFSMTHCRSYQSAEVGLFLKQKFGVKFFFDMRGFWVDERVDGNLWNMENPFYKWAYNFYKKKEASFIHYSDIIISLTEAGKREIQKWKSYQHTPIGVIPCSADFELFSLTNDLHKKKARELLGLPDNSIVMSYLGSIGTWYLLEEMLDFFKQLKLKYPNAKFLFITPTDKEEVINIAKFKSIAREDIVVKFAKRNEVTSLMKASDFSIFFIKPAYSKIASSPTKLGELFAMGLPVVCNDKVGDVGEIITQSQSGILVETFTTESYDQAIQLLPKYLDLSPSFIRSQSESYYKLDNAIQSYVEHYQSILS